MFVEGGEREREIESATVATWWTVGEEFRRPLVVETMMKRRW
jgi:hypothetical protein